MYVFMYCVLVLYVFMNKPLHYVVVHVWFFSGVVDFLGSVSPLTYLNIMFLVYRKPSIGILGKTSQSKQAHAKAA